MFPKFQYCECNIWGNTCTIHVPGIQYKLAPRSLDDFQVRQGHVHCHYILNVHYYIIDLPGVGDTQQ